MRRGTFAVILLGFALIPAAGSPARGDVSAAREHVSISGLPVLRLPTRAAVDWCGAGQPAAIDRKPELDVSSARQMHVSYAIPTDAADQLSSRAGPIVTDIAAIDAWWRGQDMARTLRFDLFDFTGCGARFGKVDIGFIRLPRASSQYLGDAGADRLLGDMNRIGELSSSHKHLVYYDGPNVFDEAVCGTAFVTRSSPTQGGISGMAFVWLRSLCGFDVGTGRIAATVAVHEAIHGLGALIQGSPNECDPPDDGHVCDATTDILYPQVTGQTSLATQTLDMNRDDYYGHSLQSFDVQDSDWLSRLPQLPLTVTLSGSGGTVRMTSPTAFDCTVPSCTLDIDSGAAVTLVAAVRTGSRFLGWRGACSGVGACQVTMDAAKTVTAAFDTSRFRLTVAITGKGKVVSTPAGITCPGRCTTTFGAGTTIRLRATATKGFRFAGWTGACRGAGVCLVPIDRDRSARAIFRSK